MQRHDMKGHDTIKILVGTVVVVVAQAEEGIKVIC